MPERPNILIVIIDSVRRDHVPFHGYHRDTAPNLTHIAESASVYENAIADGGFTPASVGSLFTGLCGREHNSEERLRLPEGIPTLAEALREAGYHTAGFSTNPFTLPVWGYGRGFEHFAACRSPKGLAKLTRILAKPFHLVDKGGEEANARLLEHLASCPEPTFAFLHHNEAHSPYGARQPYTFRYLRPGASKMQATAVAKRAHRLYSFMTRATEADFATITDLYDGQIAYQDHLVGQLWDGLEASGRLENTVVVILADHGEQLGERSYIGHAFGVDDVLLRIPLIVHAPGLLDPGSRMEGMVQTRDIARSLAELGGAAHGLAPSAAPSVDIFAAKSLSDGHPVTFSERRGLPPDRIVMEKRRTPEFDFDTHNLQIACAREHRFKFVKDARGKCELFDLEGDPAETDNVLESHPQKAAELEGKLDAWLAAQEPASDLSGGGDDASPEVIARLREFGYIP